MQGWYMAFSMLSIQYNIYTYFCPVVFFPPSVSVYIANSVKCMVFAIKFQFECSTDLTQWDARCCSDESHRCTGAAWCSDSYSAHPQAGRPECTRLPWMWWDIFVLEKDFKKKSWVEKHERRQLCGCYAESKQLLRYKEFIHSATTEAFLSPEGVCRVQICQSLILTAQKTFRSSSLFFH